MRPSSPKRKKKEKKESVRKRRAKNREGRRRKKGRGRRRVQNTPLINSHWEPGAMPSALALRLLNFL